MQIIRGIHTAIPYVDGAVISIGNYDGIHLGHKAILQSVRSLASELSLASTIITFEPYPWEFFSGEKAVPRLTTFREKIQLFEKEGIDKVLCIKFNESFAKVQPQQFVNNFLVKKLGVKYLILGKDFRFGKDRAGSIDLLRELALTAAFQVNVIDELKYKGERVSSSGIRLALQKKDLGLANTLLGRRYSLSGRVAYGDQRGRQWGIPTANIHLKPNDTPLRGVFAVLAKGMTDRTVKGVANIGTRPTVSGLKFLLETHFFDYQGEVYGKRIRIEFCDWLRDERQFDNSEDLTNQIKKDVVDARSWFKSRKIDD